MNTRFLLDEAARFRVMAEEADREATRVRLLAMAADYEARSAIADGLMTPEQREAVREVPGANRDNPVQSREGMEMPQGQMEKAAPGRRPVGRPRLGLTAKKRVPFENQ